MKNVRPAAVLRIPGSLAQVPEVVQHVGQGIEVAAVPDLGRNDVLPGDAGDGAAQVGHQEVVDGPLPAAHAGADGFLLDVLAESGSLLSQPGVEGSGDAGLLPI